MKRIAAWSLAAPATLAVLVLLIVPVGGVFATTFTDAAGVLARRDRVGDPLPRRTRVGLGDRQRHPDRRRPHLRRGPDYGGISRFLYGDASTEPGYTGA